MEVSNGVHTPYIQTSIDDNIMDYLESILDNPFSYE